MLRAELRRSISRSLTYLSEARARRGASVLPAGRPSPRNRRHASVAEGGTVFADPRLPSTLDRLLHHSYRIIIRCNSCSLCAKRKRGLIGAPAAEAVRSALPPFVESAA